MTIALPAALWGLLAIPLLVLLSFWRMRPARVNVPSVLLWKRLPPNLPPVKSLRRPTWSLVLLLQVLAVAAGVVGLAQPLLVQSRPQPRRLAVVVDLGARADLARINAELDRMAAATANDDVILITHPVLSRGSLKRVATKVDYAASPSAAIELARAEGRRVLFIGDRPGGADVEVLTGGASSNIGIVEFVPEKEGTWVKLVNLGAARDLTVRVAGREERWRVDSGESARMIAGTRLELPDDGFALDNIAVATRTEPIAVELRGDAHALLRRAIEVQPAARIVDRGGELVVSNGVDAPEPSVVIAPERGATTTPRTLSLAGHELAKGTRVEDWRLEDVADLGDGWEPIVMADGRCVVGRRGRKVVINAGLGQLPLTPSFSIFFANVLESLQSSRGRWVVRRTGPSHPKAEDGWCVLDASVTQLGGERRAFDAASLGPAPGGESRTDLSVWVIVAAAALMAAAWLMESRG